MRKQLVITDVTRMQGGRVCVAGYDKDGTCIRPVLPPPGIYESSLYAQDHPIVFPFAVVEYDLLEPDPYPPHTEDYVYAPASVRFIERLDEKGKRQVLDGTLFEHVNAIFGAPVLAGPGQYVLAGQGTRSLGTIRPQRLVKVIYEQSPGGSWKYRVGFTDGSGTTYWLTVTDLAWRYYCDTQRRQGLPIQEIASHLTSVLSSGDVYLRVGLARGWEKYPDRC